MDRVIVERRKDNSREHENGFVHDDFTRTTMISEIVTKLIVMPEDQYVSNRDSELEIVSHALADCGKDSLMIITGDIITKERRRRNSHISKRKKNELEYAHKMKMISLKVFFIKALLLMFCFIFTYSYCLSYLYAVAHNLEAKSVIDIALYLLKNVVNIN